MQQKKWHAMFSGPASTPVFSIREGETFKEALTGELICTFPETTAKTADQVAANARIIAKAKEMHELLEGLVKISPLGGQSRFNMDVTAFQAQAEALLKQMKGVS